jgi:preprotein translocase subunit SecE
MARTSRQERRQRRGVAAGTPPLQPARKPQPVEPVRAEAVESAAPKAESGAGRQEGGRGIWGVRFIREAIAELKKVEWPGQQQVVSGTAVVIVACVLVGTFLYVNDRVWSYVVQHVLLR